MMPDEPGPDLESGTLLVLEEVDYKFGFGQVIFEVDRTGDVSMIDDEPYVTIRGKQFFPYQKWRARTLQARVSILPKAAERAARLPPEQRPPAP